MRRARSLRKSPALAPRPPPSRRGPPRARRSIPFGGTSRWVTARTVVGPMTLNRTLCDAIARAANSSPAQPGAAHVEDHDVGLHPVRVHRDALQLGEALRQPPGALVVLRQPVDVVGERVDPGGRDDARPAASRRRSRCLKTHASSMNARLPASTAPTGAPSPLVRSSQTESTCEAKAAGRGSRCSPRRSSAGRRRCGRRARPRAPRGTPPRPRGSASRRRPRCSPSARWRPRASAACSAPRAGSPGAPARR